MRLRGARRRQALTGLLQADRLSRPRRLRCEEIRVRSAVRREHARSGDGGARSLKECPAARTLEGQFEYGQNDAAVKHVWCGFPLRGSQLHGDFRNGHRRIER